MLERTELYMCSEVLMASVVVFSSCLRFEVVFHLLLLLF